VAVEMTQHAIPYVFMRGGTSRGPYFNRADLPEDLDQLAEVLLAVIGSGHKLNIDGIGGGAAVTTKVAMLSRSTDNWADVDYFFAQVSVDKQLVDYKPTCGNMLTAVGPAAIEMGLVPVIDTVTEIKIRAVNTGAKVIAKVQTPNGQVNYFGDTGSSVQSSPDTYLIVFDGIVAGPRRISGSTLAVDLAPIPVPAAVWLFGSGLLGLIGFSRRKSAVN
jgi:2-methylaconitate cis-trans-isomerase PrpF